jgi:hypothetical protein
MVKIPIRKEKLEVYYLIRFYFDLQIQNISVHILESTLAKAI